MMHIPMQKYLGEYIKKVEQEEKPKKTFDEWLDEPWQEAWYELEGVKSRLQEWEPSEIEAARQAWEEARK